MYKYIVHCTLYSAYWPIHWPEIQELLAPQPSLNNGGQQGMGSGYTLYLNNHGYQSWDHLQYTKDGSLSQFSFLQLEALGKVNLNVSCDGW